MLQLHRGEADKENYPGVNFNYDVGTDGEITFEINGKKVQASQVLLILQDLFNRLGTIPRSGSRTEDEKIDIGKFMSERFRKQGMVLTGLEMSLAVDKAREAYQWDHKVPAFSGFTKNYVDKGYGLFHSTRREQS